MQSRENIVQKYPRLVVVLKGYPRLSETFIAQELLGLENAGLQLHIVSLRRPTDSSHHAVHDEIQAPVLYLPEYLHEAPLRVIGALFHCLRHTVLLSCLKYFLADLKRDFTRNRIRRFGQAMVLASEWPEGAEYLYAHFIHTPASVADYAGRIKGIPWSVSAHAKDIWTSPDWELKGKLSRATWTVTCTGIGHRHLQSLATDESKVHLSYHGLDLERFPPFTGCQSSNDGRQAHTPVTILSVGRAVEKKGFDILLRALAKLPAELHWRFVHIGGGAELAKLQALAKTLGIDARVSWLGAINQSAVLEQYRSADLFALACRITSDGDRDGLPNVLVEAASQGLACISTRVSAIPELFINEQNALLVEPEDPQSLSDALEEAICKPEMRSSLGKAAEQDVRTRFDYRASIDQLAALFAVQWQQNG
jgi:glycosyltransferase involved in cell wall biosynthesis